MEIIFILIATVLWILALLRYTSSIVETREDPTTWLCGQVVFLCAGYGGGTVVINLAKMIFH